jgi:hypothetical protein
LDADFVGYNVYNSTVPGGPYSFVASASTATSYVVGGLSSGTTYYFVVRGVDTVQESGNSPEASGTTGTPVNPYPTPPAGCPPPAPPDCNNTARPDGSFSYVYSGQELILDLGPNNGILDGPLWDLVYYEREAPGGPPPVIQMDFVTVELSIDASPGSWYVVFAWSLGDEAWASSSEIAPFASVPANSNYCDLYDGASPIDLIPMGACMLWTGLYGIPPFNTGVRIDIGGAPGLPPPTSEGYRYVRIRTRGPNPAEIDAIERLN